ncbi:MAG: glycoside hydrolase family 13 protein [Candidatus Kapabacteria bacterium]|nr:glycoside hydrolase family 13 protein [Candidatus Kapabacteria bacterium]
MRFLPLARSSFFHPVLFSFMVSFVVPCKRFIVGVAILLWSYSAMLAQSPSLPLQRIDPPSWWIGMKTPTVEFLFYGKNIAQASITTKYPGISIVKKETTDNPNYAFVTVKISPNAPVGSVPFMVKNGGETVVRTVALRQRDKGLKDRQGFNSADAVYMLMPDRFANGNASNDVVAGFPDGMHRDSLNLRHGGDLEGIISRLDYIRDLGMTAVWCTPLIENNMDKYSYHGYAFTDFYAIDKRFGSNDDYRRYVDSCHKRGLKVIQDVVLNHMGDKNYLAQDPPSPAWINDLAAAKASTNWKKEFRRPNYRTSTHSDPYASDYDKRGMTERWFDWMMPDFNANDPHLATYLIQNTIWWIEFAGLDGLRVDTYPYPAKEFTQRWAKAIFNEYPRLGMVGEVWISESVGMSSYWQANARNKDGFNSYLPAITDFPLNSALGAALNEKEEWNGGLIKIYNVLAQDYLYADASKHVIFLDNHDVSRYASVVGDDVRKIKIGLSLLMTLRGTPQIYYGTEIGMTGFKDPDPLVRKDFPGGWQGDAANAFSEAGRTTKQNEIFSHLRTLAQWRKTKPAVQSGKMMQFVPFDGIYAFFRYNADETVMVITNNNETESTVKTERFEERMKGFTKAKNVLTGEVISSLTSLTIPAKTALVLELQK